MRVKYSTLSQQITNDLKSVSLGRTSIHDAYALKFNIKYLNETGSTVTPTRKSTLDAIREISLISDSSRIHYRVNGYDLALLNARIQKVQTNDVLTKALNAVANDTYLEEEFVLYLDNGDIIATAHTNLDLQIHFADKTAENLTLISATCTVTVIEKLCTTQELFAMYGETLRGVAEPKVYTLEKTVPATSDFTGCLEIPNGSLLRGAIVYFQNDGDVMPTNTGLLRIVPDRVELANIDFVTHRALDEIIYQTTFPTGVLNWNYGTQWQDNGQGKNGWSYSRGDIQLAMKNPVETKVRYISIESLVDTQLYDATYKFTEY